MPAASAGWYGQRLGSVMERLKTRSQFQAVLAGRIVARSPHFALHRLDLTSLSADPSLPQTASSPFALFPGPRGCWVGALIPKRWAKRAATRNAIRRQIYQADLLQDCHEPGIAWVVRLRATFERRQYKSASSDALKQAVRAELCQLLARLAPRPVEVQP